MKKVNFFSGSFRAWIKMIGGLIMLIAVIVIFGKILHINNLSKIDIVSLPASLSCRIILFASQAAVAILTLSFLAVVFLIVRFIIRNLRAGLMNFFE